MTDLDLTVAAAEKIMGWKLNADYIVMGQSVHRFLGHLKGAHSWLGWGPLDSSSEALALAQALYPRGFGFRLYGPSNISPEIQDPHWVAVLYGQEQNGVYAHLECARAITIACLKAVGVETE